MSDLNNRILITGSNGLLGQKLVRYCLDNKIGFLATSSKRNNISFCPQDSFQKMDISNKEEVRKVVFNYRPTHIINAAAMTNVDACEVEVEKCYGVNKEGVAYLLEAIEEMNVHLIHISTDFIFDGAKKIYKEEDEPNPLGEYGKSKWEAERLILKSNADKTTILRTSILYGVGENLNKQNIFNWAMKELRAGKTINIVNDQFRTPTYVDDLVQAIAKVITLEKTGVFNIAGAQLKSMYEYILLVAKYLKVDVNLVEPTTTKSLSQRAPRPKSSGLNIDKAITQLKYIPTNFVETLPKIDNLV